MFLFFCFSLCSCVKVLDISKMGSMDPIFIILCFLCKMSWSWPYGAFFSLKKPIIFRLHCIVSPIFFADSWERFQFLGVCVCGNLPDFPSHLKKRCAMPRCQRYLEEPWRTTFRRVVAMLLWKCHITAGAAAAFGGEKRAEWQCTDLSEGIFFFEMFFVFLIFSNFWSWSSEFCWSAPKKRRFWEASFI